MYVKRDSEGKVLAVSVTPEPGFDEQLDLEDSGLLEVLAAVLDGAGRTEQAKRLRSSDVEMARVVEDLIALLTDKSIIQFTELPEAAQQKLLQRRSLRKGIRRLDLVEDDAHDDMMP